MIKKILAIATASLVLTTNSIGATCQTRDTYICQDYQDYVYLLAAEYEICPELIMAIIESESSGNAKAYNDKYGCIGLMQINPRAHADRMEELEITDLYIPYQNINVGVHYIRELADRYGDVAMVLGYYHGEKNVKSRTEKGELSSYVMKILERSAELEEIHSAEDLDDYTSL